MPTGPPVGRELRRRARRFRRKGSPSGRVRRLRCGVIQPYRIRAPMQPEHPGARSPPILTCECARRCKRVAPALDVFGDAGLLEDHDGDVVEIAPRDTMWKANLPLVLFAKLRQLPGAAASRRLPRPV